MDSDYLETLKSNILLHVKSFFDMKKKNDSINSKKYTFLNKKFKLFINTPELLDIEYISEFKLDINTIQESIDNSNDNNNSDSDSDSVSIYSLSSENNSFCSDDNDLFGYTSE